MRMRSERLALVALIGVMAGCAGAPSPGYPLAEPSTTAVPPLIVGAGEPVQPADPLLQPAAGAASLVTAPVRAATCAGSVALWGPFYLLYYPGEFSEDFKALIAQECAGPYAVTPAEIARFPQPWPARALRTPRTGTLPVDEMVRQGLGPR